MLLVVFSIIDNDVKDFDNTLYGNLTKEDIKKYSFLIDMDIDKLKGILQDLTLNYYKYYILNDAVNFNDAKKELCKYLDLNIPAITDYVNYCLVMASYSILNMLYDTDFDYYAPANPGLNIMGYNERQQIAEIKQHNLTNDDVKILQQNNIIDFDIWVLKDGLKVKETLKEPITPEHLQNVFLYINTSFYGAWDLKQEVKMMVGLDLVYFSNDIAKLMKKAVGKSYFDVDTKEVIHND